MKRLLIFPFLLMFASVTAQELSLLAEAGINSGGIPRFDKGHAGDKWSWRPRIYPVVGIKLQRYTRIGLFGELNVRYTSTGGTDTFFNDERDRPVDFRFTAETVQKFIFNKVAYGAGIGYSFRLWNKTLLVNAGYRRIYFHSGSYQYSLTSVDKNGTRVGPEKRYDPFSEPNLDMPAKRSGREIYAGAGIGVGNRTMVQLNYILTSWISFTENMMGHTSWDHHGYSSDDITITMTYRLNK